MLIGVNYDNTLNQSELLSLSNVHWLGLKKYEELFEYLLCFDVAIIPFKINEITLSTSPIKLFEYAACQKPIVTTALPECLKYPEVKIGHTPDEFIIALDEAALNSNNLAMMHALDNLAKSNSWQSRAEMIIARIQR